MIKITYHNEKVHKSLKRQVGLMWMYRFILFFGIGFAILFDYKLSGKFPSAIDFIAITALLIVKTVYDNNVLNRYLKFSLYGASLDANGILKLNTCKGEYEFDNPKVVWNLARPNSRRFAIFILSVSCDGEHYQFYISREYLTSYSIFKNTIDINEFLSVLGNPPKNLGLQRPLFF